MEREKHWIARKVKEAILINAVNPTKKIEADGVLNLEKGYEVDPIWSGFNGDFRAMLCIRMCIFILLFSVGVQ